MIDSIIGNNYSETYTYVNLDGVSLIELRMGWLYINDLKEQLKTEGIPYDFSYEDVFHGPRNFFSLRFLPDGEPNEQVAHQVNQDISAQQIQDILLNGGYPVNQIQEISDLLHSINDISSTIPWTDQEANSKRFKTLNLIGA